jgi:hypothetical protein
MPYRDKEVVGVFDVFIALANGFTYNFGALQPYETRFIYVTGKLVSCMQLGKS